MINSDLAGFGINKNYYLLAARRIIVGGHRFYRDSTAALTWRPGRESRTLGETALGLSAVQIRITKQVLTGQWYHVGWL